MFKAFASSTSFPLSQKNTFLLPLMAKLTFICYLLLLMLCVQTQIFHVKGQREFRISNNCSYTVWPASNLPYYGINADPILSLQTLESTVIRFQSGTGIQFWGRTNCTNSTAGVFACQTGDCGSGHPNCTGSPTTTTTNILEFSLNQFNGLDFYDVSLVNGYGIPVSVVPVGGNGSKCPIIGCIFDVASQCPQELVNGTVCQSPCAVTKAAVYCCSGGGNKCQPTVYSKLFKQACPRAYSYALDDATSTFSCEGSPNYTITFCPTSTTIISELSKPFQAANASALSPGPGPQMQLSPLPLSPGPSDNFIPQRTKKVRIPLYLVIGIPTSIAILIFLFSGIRICMKKRKARGRDYAEIEEMRSMDFLQFDINTIRAATHNFSDDNKLGEGGFGEVYKGKLDSGQEVAVKRLLHNSKQGTVEFKTEVVLVAKLQHKNLVKLLGFCVTSKEKILVYEFVPNSSLDRFLFDSSSKVFLGWKTRFNIIIGITRGLMYLHEDSRLKVIHRDLKTSNILLDEAMNPKISDFGLARLFGDGQTQGDTKRIVGTYGYMAPEYAITGHYSAKSDVYSYGVMVLEIISGQKTRFFGGLQHEETLLHRAWRLWNERKPLDLVDTRLNEDIPYEVVTRCFHVGVLCIQEDPIQRPGMRLILDALTNPSTSLPEPTPPRFLGNPNTSDQSHHIVPHPYSGCWTDLNYPSHKCTTWQSTPRSRISLAIIFNAYDHASALAEHEQCCQPMIL